MKLLLMIMAILVSSCSINKSKIKIERCTKPEGSEMEVPLWICKRYKDGDKLFGIGYADKSISGLDFMKKISIEDANIKLTQLFREELLRKIIQTYQPTTQEQNELINIIADNIRNEITIKSLGTTVITSEFITQNGGLFVLVNLSETNFNKLLENNLKKLIISNNEVWEELHPQKTEDKIVYLIVNG